MTKTSETWFELREPGCVPERKGPMPPQRVASFLRELFAARPSAYVTVITMGYDGPLLQDGPECLQMLDGRSMSVGRRHILSSRAADAPPVVEEAVKAEPRVRELEWQQVHSKAKQYRAEPVTGPYTAVLINDCYRLDVRDGDYMKTLGTFATREAFEAAAQADFSARILSALSFGDAS